MAEKSRRGLALAIVGGVVLLAGVVAFAWIGIGNMLDDDADETQPDPQSSQTSAPTPAPSSSATPAGDVVDPSVTERGWVPEPITTDAAAYATAAIEAAGTVDTTLSTRDEWVSYLETWYSPEYVLDRQERNERISESRLGELRHDVAYPEEVWDSLASERGRVTATVVGEPDLIQSRDDMNGRSVYTASVDVTQRRTSPDGQVNEFTEQVRVSIEVECSPETVPAPNSAQRSGDCKVARWLPEPSETGEAE